MKKGILALTLVLAVGLTSFQGCIGNFNLTKKVLNWNQHISNKFVNEVVFLVMVIIPVYGITVFIDGIILNSLEFWTGSSPLSMNPGEVETKYLSKDGVSYKIEVSQNKYHFLQTEGPNAGDQADLIYNPATKTWCLGNGKEIKKMVQYLDNKEIKIFKKDGTSITVSSDSTSDDIAALLNSRM